MTTSPDQTLILAGTTDTITDTYGGVWSIENGKVMLDGTIAGFTSNVAELYFLATGNLISQKNATGSWYAWDYLQSTWVAKTPNPLPGVAPPAPPPPPPSPVVLAKAQAAVAEALTILIAASAVVTKAQTSVTAITFDMAVVKNDIHATAVDLRAVQAELAAL